MHSKRIFKYPLKVVDEQTITVPQDAQLLNIQDQQGGLVLWMVVSDSNDAASAGKGLKNLKLRIIGTGHPIDDFDKLMYLTTVQQHDGALVWHIFIVDDAELFDATTGEPVPGTVVMTK